VSATLEQLDTSPWPHRLAVALECVTFPLIWVGGLVTTYDAGMAVPDWPNTYGYNLFAYPWQTWLFGPWGLFIEHGHRLLGALAGMLSIALVVAAWCCQRDPLVRWLSIATLAAVIFQGSLGGLRVIEDQVQMARIHGCVGPAFFALTVAMDVVTSQSWRRKSVPGSVSLAKVERYAVMTTLLAYCQLVLGSFLRHLPAGADPGDFRVALVFHLGMAAVLLAHVVLLAVEVFRIHWNESWLRAPSARLLVLFVL
jgi:heme a synthase